MHDTLIIHAGQGRGRLARSASVTVFCADDSPVTRSLVGWCRVAGQGTATDAVGDLTALQDGADVGDACAIITHPDRTHTVLVHGELTMVIDPEPPETARHNRGRWVVHQLPGDLGQVTVESLPADAALDVSLSLDAGVVPADGFVWRSAAPDTAGCTARTGCVEPAPAEPESRTIIEGASTSAADAGVVPLGHTDELPPPSPLPVGPNGSEHAATPDGEPARVPTGAVRTRGLHCSRGHFNDPRARFCALCGIAMHQTSFVMTEGDRPPLGVLVFNDGTYHTLVRTLVVGRMPDDDTEVRAGRSHACVLVDPGNTISRVHAEVRTAGWDVHLVDRESSNGTFVWANDRNQWNRLVAHQPTLLTPGTTVAFGSVTATFESANLQKR
jgi:FHA domain